MALNITYRHIESTPSIREKIEKKVQHLKKYFKGQSDIHWVCSVEKDRHISEVNIHAGHSYFHAKSEGENLYKTLDSVIKKIERQLQKKQGLMHEKKSVAQFET